jgi:histidyl-tRNA synthetase
MLKAMAQYSGFPAESYDTVFIILDKMDKIGLDGVAEELAKEGFAKESIDTYLGLFKEITSDIEGVRYCKEKLKDVLDPKVAEDLETIISTVDAVKTADFKIAFDPTLVRGMSYYTGPIFEIAMDEFGGSVGGGGRYDEMIGKFTGNNTCACGFSIGFERIVMLLLERGYEIPTAGGKKAYLIEKNMPAEKLTEILRQAEEERRNGTQVNISIMKKNKKFQKDQMMSEGYTEFKEFFRDKI